MQKQKALLIAEKPDLMRKIEAVYDKYKDRLPYEAVFVSQRGHLVTLKYPDEIDETLKDWSWDTLPIAPEEHGGWQYKVIEEKKTGNFQTSRERYDVIRSKIYSGDYDFVINAGDPDQEGELLVRLVLSKIKNRLPVKRFWTNDLTEKHILYALENLRDDENDPQLVRLLDAAYGRQHSDYRFGMNISRAATLKMGARVACGRVKTPIQAIVCKREKEIENFKPETTYGIRAVYKEGFEGTLFVSEEFEDEEDNGDMQDTGHGTVWFKTKKEAENVIAGLGDTLTVIEYTAKRQSSYAPKLFKLAAAQVEAGKLGYSAADTLRIIQGLYEQKFMSYPRTGCEYLGGDEDFTAMLKSASAVPDLAPYIEKITAADISRVKKTKTWINPPALQDEGHSALVPTSNRPVWDELDKEQKDIYGMICRQFVAAFLDPLVQDKAVLVAETGGRTFRSSGKTLVSPGWTKLFGRGFTDTLIPVHKKGDTLEAERFDIPEKTTTCPKRYTSADLVSICENPLKFLDNRTYRKLGRKLKIGTPATRAGIIDELITKDKYLKEQTEKKRRVIVPTKIGMKIIDDIGDCDICKVDLTGEWEEKLEKVRNGSMGLSDLEEGMREHVAKMVDDIKHRDMEKLELPDSGYKELGRCPVCGKKLMRGPSRFYCTGYKEGCAAGGFRQRDGASITDEEFMQMIGGAAITKQMQRNGMNWQQEIRCDKTTGKIIYPAAEEDTGLACPLCGKKIVRGHTYYACEGVKDKACTIRVSRSIGGVTIPDVQFRKLLTEGMTDTIEGFYSEKKKKHYSAYLYIDKEEKRVGMKFSDPEKQTDYKCPVCGRMLLQKGYRYICPGTKDDTCGFSMYNTASKKMIPDATVRAMLKKVESGDIGGGGKAFISGGPAGTGFKCPVCGKDMLREGMKFYCKGASDGTCTFSFYRMVSGYVLDDAEIGALLSSGRTPVIKLFISKKGTAFAAALVIDKEKKAVGMEFAENSGEESSYTCPLCGKKMTENKFKLSCSCGFSVWKKQGGKELTKKNLADLFTKGSTAKIKMKSKEGRQFEAKIVIDKENKRTKYSFGG